ncbi:FkbM family methyltransferase [uncultured Desulfobacter sp.]|uniref:FkbM family methyltransferase n=1 Tax=uncultured Desulfobacter sp. TaxID=240139 RepID=UPI002AA7642D|nr:FkbM family methyltransferase [uncultured Desulfobacter sp.]
MVIKRKLKTALRILKKQGILQLTKRSLSHIACLLNLSYICPQLRVCVEVDESKLVYTILKESHPRGVMIDVGAHWGSALEPFANSDWQVYAFEPDVNNRKQLKAGFGDYKNVIIDPRALADKEQENIDFYTSNQSSGISGLSAFHESHESTDKVNTTTLKKVIQSFDIKVIDFLKIDTEGYDFFVLKGLPWDILKPGVIVCEFEDAKTTPLGYNVYNLANFLLDKGYKVMVSEWYPIIKYGGNHKWKKFVEYPSKLDDKKGWGNLIAVRYHTHYKLLKKYCLKYIDRENDK